MNAMKQILGCIRKADQDYGMIADHDRIAVGVSGGKDSMLLLYCLHLYQQFCRRIQSKQFEVVGIHIQMGFPGRHRGLHGRRSFFQTARHLPGARTQPDLRYSKDPGQ